MGLFLPQALLPHFILGYINKAFSSVQHRDQIWWRNDECPLSIHKTATYYCLPGICAHAHTHTQTHLNCVTCIYLEAFSNLAVVKVHQASLVIDWSSLSSDLRQRIRGITSFERFDVTRPRPVLLCSYTLMCPAGHHWTSHAINHKYFPMPGCKHEGCRCLFFAELIAFDGLKSVTCCMHWNAKLLSCIFILLKSCWEPSMFSCTL